MDARKLPSTETVRQIVTETIRVLTNIGHLKDLDDVVRGMLVDVVTTRIRPSSRAPRRIKSKAFKTTKTSKQQPMRLEGDSRPKIESEKRDGPKIVMPVEESVTDELIYCLFDRVGRKMISRHILAKYNMTWPQYLEYCGLPNDYPRVAPKYSEQVSGTMAAVMTKKPATGAEAQMRRQRALEVKRAKLLEAPGFGLSAKQQHGDAAPGKTDPVEQ